MTMPEMQKAISKLRFLLAAIKGKEEDLEGLRRQFRRQLDRAPNYAIHGGNSLEATLSIMEEIRERLEDVEKMGEHLSAIKKRTEDELRALDLTDKIEQAKTELAALKKGHGLRRPSGRVNQEKIEELERFIQDASIRAGEAITGRSQEADRGRS